MHSLLQVIVAVLAVYLARGARVRSTDLLAEGEVALLKDKFEKAAGNIHPSWLLPLKLYDGAAKAFCQSPRDEIASDQAAGVKFCPVGGSADPPWNEVAKAGVGVLPRFQPLMDHMASVFRLRKAGTPDASADRVWQAAVPEEVKSASRAYTLLCKTYTMERSDRFSFMERREASWAKACDVIDDQLEPALGFLVHQWAFNFDPVCAQSDRMTKACTRLNKENMLEYFAEFATAAQEFSAAALEKYPQFTAAAEEKSGGIVEKVEAWMVA